MFKNLISLLLMVLAFCSCDKQEITEPSVQKTVNFFPINLGNQWNYSVWFRKSGNDLPTEIFTGNEIIKIIKIDSLNHESTPDAIRFQVYMQLSGKNIFESAGGDSTAVTEIATQFDTLEMAIRDSLLVYLYRQKDKQFYFPRWTSGWQVVLPDTGSTVYLETDERHEIDANCILRKGVGFESMIGYHFGPGGGYDWKLILESFNQGDANTVH